MIGLIVSIVIFNTVAFLTNKRLNKNQIVHIWLFTIYFQAMVDVYLDLKYHGYWYFTKAIDWESIPTVSVLLPPVNIMFLNWYPLKKAIIKQAFYIIIWVIFMVEYELLALLPEPWGYFHYGWWKLGYSAICDPVLLIILLRYYKWILKIEKEV